MSNKYLRTSDLARAAGIHANTVRLYADWGLLPPVERSASGYRLFTQQHLDCLRLARTIYAAEYPGRGLRASGNAIIQCAVTDDWQGALTKAREHLVTVKTELQHAETAAEVLEHWAQNEQAKADEILLPLGEVARLLGVSHDVIRNWERDGLLRARRNPDNNYRRFGVREIERLRIIHMLAHAGYSHMAILRMFIELDGGNTRDLKAILDTPRADEDSFTTADHWLTTLQSQEALAKHIIEMVSGVIGAREAQETPCPTEPLAR